MSSTNEFLGIGGGDMIEREERDEIAGVSVDVSGGAKRKKLKSSILSHFDVLPLSHDKEVRSNCKTCGQTYLCSSKHGTGNMSHHIKTYKRIDTHDIGQILESRESGNYISADFYTPEKWRESLCHAIIKHDLPFQFVEYEAIRYCFQLLRPDVEIIGIDTVKHDVLKMFEKEKMRIKDMLASAPGRISLTSDLWSSITTDGYMCLTAHFIDKDWKLQKIILNFCEMPPPHTGIVLSEKLHSLLVEWGIEDKIFSKTLDNAVSNDISVDALQTELSLKGYLPLNGEFFHLRCYAHILNLVVQDGLKEIDVSIEKIRDSVKYVKGSQLRKQKFLECVKKVFVDKECRKALCQDVATRWNSTYLMLESALSYRLAFQYLALSDNNYKHCPSDEEWERIEKISRFLKVFYDTTLWFSGTKYPTANLYFVSIICCYVTIKESLSEADAYMKSMARRMWTKFHKYWSSFSPILTIAVVLDPSYKLRLTESCYDKAFGKNSIEFQNVLDKFKLLFEEYKGKADDISSSSLSMSSTSNKETTLREPMFLKFLKGYYSRKDLDRSKAQFDLYFDEPLMNWHDELDVLAYWKTNKLIYPELAAMARDILSVPVSTVASDSTFSTGGRILDQFRNCLNPATVEALVCCSDWLYGDKEIEDLTRDLVNISLDEVGQTSSS